MIIPIYFFWILFVGFPTIIPSCATNQNEVSHFSIQLNGYNPSIHKNFLEITSGSYLSRSKKQYFIPPDGRVEFTLIIPQPQEIELSYEQSLIQMIVSPKDTLVLEINIRELLVNNGPLKGRIIGNYAKTNDLILKHYYRVNHWIDSSDNAFLADKHLKENEYKNLRLLQMKEQMDSLHLFLRDFHINDSLFLDWAETKIFNAAGIDLCIFPFIGRINRDLDEENDYFDFLSKIHLQNSTAIQFISNLDYFKTLSSSFQIIGNISFKYKRLRDNSQNDAIVLDLFEKLRSEAGEQAATVYLTQVQNDISKPIRDSLFGYLGIHEIKEILPDNKPDSRSVSDLLDEYPLSSAEKQELKELFQSSHGKTVFHDFWFSSCGPCMAEFPHYNELISKAGDDVEFVFWGVYMDESTWRKTIDKFKLDGRHILLNKNQLAFFENYFNVDGFPHHQIVDKNGTILKNRIPQVNPHTIPEILSIFEQNNH